MKRQVALVIPFPQARRRRFISRNAARLAAAEPKTAEKLLFAILRQQSDVMARKSIAPAQIERECRSLEVEIRAQLWRQILTPEGAA